MKALVVADDEKAINNISQVLKSAGYDPIVYKWLLKALDNIEEIRIEGHTNSNGGYFSNMELSQNRTRAVLQYCLNMMPEEDMAWAKALITANGLSSSHLIMKDGQEDKELSRRVEFRVRTNAEKQLEEIAAKRSIE